MYLYIKTCRHCQDVLPDNDDMFIKNKTYKFKLFHRLIPSIGTLPHQDIYHA